ncbi:hypothetical protein NBRC10512_002422 [Rhodotorula toruloides]|uniref:RHTO0S03e05732g1_1 n=2 Tax=Rhodotorula toruloides TaxID=5286 RepID=A0A061AKW8_RHOTO|nr:uncharacterized protein RHTO_00288 [Rhodotorula toruloides NP11]EMS25860.1 hypothetical protein RHTO_00288 [Rhodotorula toruloides NP11]CDR38203.1 RHTO0S03e05732g1_1 [Rhodotorula toruloides]
MPSSQSSSSSSSSASTTVTSPEPSPIQGKQEVLDLSLDSDVEIKAEDDDGVSCFSDTKHEDAVEPEDEADQTMEGREQEERAESVDAVGPADAKIRLPRQTKKEEEEQKLFDVLVEEEKTFRRIKRPWLKTHPNLNILDETTWEGCAQLHPTGPGLDTLRAHGGFDRWQIGGYRVRTLQYPSEGSRCQSSLRIATRADLNVATRRPGLPWVWTTGPDMWNHRDDYDNRHAAFVQLTPRKRGHLQWTMFGDYNIIWAGYLEDGEFARLPPAKQRRTVELLLRYTRDKVAFARFIFRNCFVERENGTAVNVQAANKEEQEERVWKALMDNDGSLSLVWTMMVYHGINEQEFEECESRPKPIPGAKKKEGKAKGTAGKKQRVKKARKTGVQKKADSGETARSRKRSQAPTPDVKPKRRRVGAQ